RATQLLAAAGVAFYSTAFSSQALFSKAFRGYRLGLFALPLAVSMEAHYRAANQLGKAFFEDYCQYRPNRSNTHQTMRFSVVFTPRYHQH
ncbi:hypothetical protein, partial [Aeromonas enteropelogenes]|uniref:hypothetical protein n=1 Tax=Aeromonas enteropelogenes TaxID=29489 RepID=UPI003B9EFF6E